MTALSLCQPVTWLASLLTVIRLLLVFVFLVSNYLPGSRAMTVVIHWDWTLAITVTVFSLLGGFISHHLRARILRWEVRGSTEVLNCLVFQSGNLGDISEPGGHEGSSDLNVWCNLWTLSLLAPTSSSYDTNIISFPPLNRRSHTEKYDLQLCMLGNKGFLFYFLFYFMRGLFLRNLIIQLIFK